MPGQVSPGGGLGGVVYPAGINLPRTILGIFPLIYVNAAKVGSSLLCWPDRRSPDSLRQEAEISAVIGSYYEDGMAKRVSIFAGHNGSRRLTIRRSDEQDRTASARTAPWQLGDEGFPGPAISLARRALAGLDPPATSTTTCVIVRSAKAQVVRVIRDEPAFAELFIFE